MANGVRPAAPNQAAEAVVKRDFFKGAASLFGAGILGAVTKCTTIIALNYVALAWGVVGTLACYSVTKLGPIFSDGYEAARQEFQDLIARKVSLGNASLGAAAGAIVTLASSALSAHPAITATLGAAACVGAAYGSAEPGTNNRPARRAVPNNVAGAFWNFLRNGAPRNGQRQGVHFQAQPAPGAAGDLPRDFAETPKNPFTAVDIAGGRQGQFNSVAEAFETLKQLTPAQIWDNAISTDGQGSIVPLGTPNSIPYQKLIMLRILESMFSTNLIVLQQLLRTQIDEGYTYDEFDSLPELLVALQQAFVQQAAQQQQQPQGGGLPRWQQPRRRPAAGAFNPFGQQFRPARGGGVQGQWI